VQARINDVENASVETSYTHKVYILGAYFEIDLDWYFIFFHWNHYKETRWHQKLSWTNGTKQQRPSKKISGV